MLSFNRSWINPAEATRDLYNLINRRFDLRRYPLCCPLLYFNFFVMLKLKMTIAVSASFTLLKQKVLRIVTWWIATVLYYVIRVSVVCVEIIMSPPRPWGEGGHLDLLWFPHPNVCCPSASVCVHLCQTLFTQYFLQFFQWLSNSQIW